MKILVLIGAVLFSAITTKAVPILTATPSQDNQALWLQVAFNDLPADTTQTRVYINGTYGTIFTLQNIDDENAPRPSNFYLTVPNSILPGEHTLRGSYDSGGATFDLFADFTVNPFDPLLPSAFPAQSGRSGIPDGGATGLLFAGSLAAIAGLRRAKKLH